jgi:ATP-dependent Clp protease protease subunit
MGYVRVPYVLEHTAEGTRLVDLYSRLLSDRIILLTGEVDDPVADSLTAQLLYLEAQDPDKDIYFYINSPGGSVTAGLAIYDILQYIRCDVVTLCLGQAASMGALLLTAGTKGKRIALPTARVMIHQPLGGAQGQASDVEAQAKELLRIKALTTQILMRHTGQPEDVIRRDTDRDFFLTAEEAKAYGLIDHVMAQRKGERSEA